MKPDVQNWMLGVDRLIDLLLEREEQNDVELLITISSAFFSNTLASSSPITALLRSHFALSRVREIIVARCSPRLQILYFLLSTLCHEALATTTLGVPETSFTKS